MFHACMGVECFIHRLSFRVFLRPPSGNVAYQFHASSFLELFFMGLRRTQKKIYMKTIYKKQCALLFLILLGSFANPLRAVDFVHKNITVTIGESFIISPWDDSGLNTGLGTFNVYKCLRTYIQKNRIRENALAQKNAQILEDLLG